MLLISDNDTSIKRQRRRRIHAAMPKRMTSEAMQKAIAEYIKPYTRDYQMVLVLVYPNRSAQRFGGWIAKALWQGGNRIEITTDNDPDLREWIMLENRQ